MKPLLIALCALLLVACPEEPADGEPTLTLTITSDLRVPQELDLVTVRVSGQETERDPAADLLVHPLPRKLTLVHESGPLGPFPITVYGYKGSDQVIRHDLTASFPASGNSDLTVNLERSCRNVSCGPTQTCEQGKCIPLGDPEDAGTPIRDAGPRDAHADADAQPAVEDAALDASVDAGTDSAVPEDSGADAGAAPSCTISLPIVGDVYQNGVFFPLQGSCTDAETGGPLELTWLSSRDGLLGTGASLEARLTSAGAHRLSLCAPDPRDAMRVGCGYVDVEGSAEPQPSATIVSIAQGNDVSSPYLANQPLVYTAVVTGAGVVATWSDDMQGPIGNGVSATLPTPFVGRHTVTLTVRDRNSVQRTSSLAYVVLGAGETGLISPLSSVNMSIPGNPAVTSIASDPQSRAYVPSSMGPWYRFDGTNLNASATVAINRPPLRDAVQDAQLSNGAAYLATRDGLTVCPYASTGPVEPCSNYRAGGLLQSQNFLSVLRMVDNRNVDLLLLGSDNGLFISESVNGSTRGSTILRPRIVYDMAALNGQAALALDNGLTLLVPSTQTQVRFTTAEGLPSNQLRNLAVAQDNTLWIATTGGLAHFEPGTNKITAWTTMRGLPSNTVNGVAVQRPPQLGRDIVWVATSAGVVRLDPSNDAISVFTNADGLPNNNVLAVHVLANGTKLFGTASGLARYVGF